MLRELGRLETSLKCAGEREKLVFLHYPPKFANYECREFIELMESYGVRECYYGHIHSAGCPMAFQGVREWSHIPAGFGGLAAIQAVFSARLFQIEIAFERLICYNALAVIFKGKNSAINA